MLSFRCKSIFMNVVHFIGCEAKGGNVRYAEVMHQCLVSWGVNSVLLPVGKTPSPEGLETLSAGPLLLVIHSSSRITRIELQRLRTTARCRLIVFAHNPQLPKNWDLYDLVVPVSEYVRQVLLESGIERERVYTHPTYFPAFRLGAVETLVESSSSNPVQRSEYEWNPRKPRDFIFRYFDHLDVRPWRYGSRRLTGRNTPEVSSRIRLAIVSRIARLKQFPELFRLLHGGLVKVADKIEIHVIGAGPWNQVQALKSRIPSEVRSSVIFWGWQSNPWACLSKIDALLLGMPEKEALGLNILEATLRKIPVIAIDGGPFQELIEVGRNGWILSRDSIQRDFLEVISTIEGGYSSCSFEMSDEYKYRFSERRFYETVRDLLGV